MGQQTFIPKADKGLFKGSKPNKFSIKTIKELELIK
jgi:hypothetical protein